jgi:pimeloyl-ACP methyl ester carboxylesterase
LPRPTSSGSPGTLLPLPIPALAGILCRLLDRLGHEQVDVLGYSFGGAVAQQLARAEPYRIRRLALVSTWCGWGGDPGSPAAVARAVPANGNPLGCSYQLWSLATWSSLPWLDRIETPTLVVPAAPTTSSRRRTPSPGPPPAEQQAPPPSGRRPPRHVRDRVRRGAPARRLLLE